MVTASAPRNASPVLEPSASFVQRGISILTLLSLFIVVCIPVVYVGGRAYHDGWYERLHLNPGLFPSDTQAILTYGFIGWTGAVSRLMKALLTSIDRHMGLLIVLVVLGFPLFSFFHWLYAWAHRISTHQRLMLALHPRLRVALRWLAPSVKPGLTMMLIIIGALQVAFSWGLALFLAINPPLWMGRHDAEVQIASDFKGSPEMSLKDPTGNPIHARLIGCGPQLCAVWAHGHASTVQLASISWADSPPPEPVVHSQEHENSPAPTPQTRKVVSKAGSTS